MKRIFTFMFLLAILAIIYQFGVTFLKSGHDITYDLVSENIKFKVREIYDKKKSGYYTLVMENSDYSFIYEVKDNFNKRKKIIQDIQATNNDNMMCIYPIYLKDTLSSNITCSIKNDKTTYSYNYYKDNPLVKQLEESLRSKNIVNESWNKDEIISTPDGIVTHYKENIMKEDIIVIWLYNNIYIADNDRTYYVSLFDNDIYENKLGTLIGYNYYIPKYNDDNLQEFATYYRINIKRREKHELKLTDILSKNTYLNGVIDDKLYIFDPKNLVQYEISDDSNNPRKIGDKSINAQYYNGTWQDKNINDFKDTEIKFVKDYSKVEELKQYKYTEIYETDRYYYLNNAGEISRLYKNDLSKRVVLFKLDNLRSITVNKDTVYFIIGDTLYYYNENKGIKKIIQRNEFNYNYKNIYAVYKGE